MVAVPLFTPATLAFTSLTHHRHTPPPLTALVPLHSGPEPTPPCAAPVSLRGRPASPSGTLHHTHLSLCSTSLAAGASSVTQRYSAPHPPLPVQHQSRCGGVQRHPAVLCTTPTSPCAAPVSLRGRPASPSGTLHYTHLSLCSTSLAAGASSVTQRYSAPHPPLPVQHQSRCGGVQRHPAVLCTTPTSPCAAPVSLRGCPASPCGTLHYTHLSLCSTSLAAGASSVTQRYSALHPPLPVQHQSRCGGVQRDPAVLCTRVVLDS